MSRVIIFSHRRAIGDALMFTCGVRDFKLLFPEIKVIVNSNFPQCFYNNPYIEAVMNKKTELVAPPVGVEFYKVGYPIINNANHASTHFTQGFLFDMIASAGLHESLGLDLHKFCSAFANGRIGDPDIESASTLIYKEKKKGGLSNLPEKLSKMFLDKDSFCQHFGRIRPDVHLSEEEKNTNFVRKHYGVENYWVVAPGGKRDCTCKIWDWRRFQKVVDHFRGFINFVIIGRSDHLLEKLDGVIDLTDKFNNDVRKLFPLVYHAEGCVSGISFIHHLCAAMPHKNNSRAFAKPCITIYGGREPITFTNYNQTYALHTGGSMDCCSAGGCWHSRVVPLPKDKDKNKRLCRMPVEDNGRTIQKCMDNITADDVIRQLEIIYSGDLFKSANPVTRPINYVKRDFVKRAITIESSSNSIEGKEINFLASMKTDGGGEQSAAHIVKLLRDRGVKVNFYPWANVHKRFSDCDIEKADFETMSNVMKKDLPLFFYANDNISDFVKKGQPLVSGSSSVVIGINYVNGALPKCDDWLAKKLRGVVFQNTEKLGEFERDQIGLDHVRRVVLFGAINLDKFVEVCIPKRDGKKIVISKHCKPDHRKYVTTTSVNKGEKIHIWQKKFDKELDTRFYSRLLKDTKNTYFEFMEAHKELVREFKGEPRMKFFQWDEIPVDEFLSRGHVYLYRSSNLWRDQYPRVVAEALAAGMPVLSEPRDGTKDRIIHGDTGFYCTHYDEYLLAIRTFQRKEGLRHAMGMNAKDWARINLNPKKWIEVLGDILEMEGSK